MGKLLSLCLVTQSRSTPRLPLHSSTCLPYSSLPDLAIVVGSPYSQ